MILFRLILLLAALSSFAYRAAVDDGRGIDPNGGTTASVSCDEGNGLDPHGG